MLKRLGDSNETWHFIGLMFEKRYRTEVLDRGSIIVLLYLLIYVAYALIRTIYVYVRKSMYS